jgi:hypothetical protein
MQLMQPEQQLKGIVPGGATLAHLSENVVTWAKKIERG